MAHPYPPRWRGHSYIGRHHYSLTFCTDARRAVFTSDQSVELVRTQVLRACRECRFEIPAYCFMPDHLHLLVAGLDQDADCRRSIKLSKQYSGYYFSRENGSRLWQRYPFERALRDEIEIWATIGYIVANPVRAGLVTHPSEYPYLGSTCYTMDELLAISEYEQRGSSA